MALSTLRSRRKLAITKGEQANLTSKEIFCKSSKDCQVCLCTGRYLMNNGLTSYGLPSYARDSVPNELKVDTSKFIKRVIPDAEEKGINGLHAKEQL